MAGNAYMNYFGIQLWIRANSLLAFCNEAALALFNFVRDMFCPYVDTHN